MHGNDTKDSTSPTLYAMAIRPERSAIRALRGFVLLAAAISCAACTTLRPIEGTSTELRQRISSGELLKAGDRVLILTTDHKMHRFTITGIDAGLIEGRTDSVPVEQIVSLERRQFSRGKTLVLVALGVGLAVYVAAQAALVDLLAGST